MYMYTCTYMYNHVWPFIHTTCRTNGQDTPRKLWPQPAMLVIALLIYKPAWTALWFQSSGFSQCHHIRQQNCVISKRLQQWSSLAATSQGVSWLLARMDVNCVICGHLIFIPLNILILDDRILTHEPSNSSHLDGWLILCKTYSTNCKFFTLSAYGGLWQTSHRMPGKYHNSLKKIW